MLLQLFIVCVVVSKSALALPVSGIAKNVKSDLTLLPANNNAARYDDTNAVLKSPISNNFKFNKLPIGEALDLFYRYGFFSLSVRVVPREDHGSWLIREPTAVIFEPGSLSETVTHKANKFDSQFQIFFADDDEELLEAYFRDFSADGIEQPHKLFTGSWHKKTKSRYLGLSKSIFESQDDIGFVLVKLSKARTVVSMSGNPQLNGEATQQIHKMHNGDEQSVIKFIKNYGSHVVRDVVVGDVIYQVFALKKDQYISAKKSIKDLMVGANEAQLFVPFENDRFNEFYHLYLAPWQVIETGKIGVASGDDQVFRFVENELVATTRTEMSFSNIFRLREDVSLMERLESLTEHTSAVIGLNFKSLRNWIPDFSIKKYYDGVMAKQSALWESNL